MMIRRSKILLIFSLIVIIFTACSKSYEGDFSFVIEDFTFTNQDGEQISKSDDLDGEFWIADFIFTNCETVCPPMTANKARLQQLLKDEGLEDIQLVSFSVDPERDKPDVLKKYGKERGIEFDNAHFLTGYEFSDIENFSMNSFKTAIAEEPDSDQISHTTSFFIISPDGEALKRYDGSDQDAMDEIVEYIKKIR